MHISRALNIHHRSQQAPVVTAAGKPWAGVRLVDETQLTFSVDAGHVECRNPTWNAESKQTQETSVATDAGVEHRCWIGFSTGCLSDLAGAVVPNPASTFQHIYLSSAESHNEAALSNFPVATWDVREEERGGDEAMQALSRKGL